MTSDYQELSLNAAEAVAEQLRAKPESCFGLPSGRSPLGCYQLLSQWSRQGTLDWSRARCFALDDYLDAEESKSFTTYLEENLYKHTNLPREGRLNPRYCNDYDGLIAGSGGLDLTIVGIGRNGHVAFNEPGTPRQSWTHCVWLTASTMEANASYFGGQELVPRLAVTMGLETILQSRKVLLLVSGAHKKEILDRALSTPPTKDIPASFLQEHRALQILVDFP